MLQHINMLRYRFVFLIFLSLIIFVQINAHACSVPPPVVPWQPGYNIYEHYNQKKPFNDYDSISIVTPSFEEVTEKDFEAFRYTKKGHEKFTHVKFNVVKILKGKNIKNFYLRGGGSGFETVTSNSKTIGLKKSIIRDPIYLRNLDDEDKNNYYWSQSAIMYAEVSVFICSETDFSLS